MWQRFTDRARKVILLGQEEARRFGSPSVGTEHLLLGLVREQEGTAAHILEQMGVQLEAMRGEVEKVSPPVDAPRGEPNLSPRAKRVLELAADEARRFRHNYIGTEHLLLALLREKDGVAAKVLRALGVGLDSVRAAVGEYLGEGTRDVTTSESEARRYVTVQPDLHMALRRLMETIEAEAASRTESERHTLLELQERLSQLVKTVLARAQAASAFEQSAKWTGYCIDWYKERAVEAADYERAAHLRDLKSDFDELIEVIRERLKD